MCIEYELKQLTAELETLCKEYQGAMVEVEKQRERIEIKEKLGRVWQKVEGKLGIDKPGLLIALLDTYEVTRDEGMLQKVLDVVSENLDQLAIGVESVKLLAYCFYYVEDEECAQKAKQIVEEIKLKGRDQEIQTVEQVCNEYFHF